MFRKADALITASDAFPVRTMHQKVLLAAVLYIGVGLTENQRRKVDEGERSCAIRRPAA